MYYADIGAKACKFSSRVADVEDVLIILSRLRTFAFHTHFID